MNFSPQKELYLKRDKAKLVLKKKQKKFKKS